MPDNPKRIGLYGRSRSKALRGNQQELINDLLPKLGLPKGKIDPKLLWPDAPNIKVEIGLGGGEHFVHQAALTPDAHLIGFEPFLNGMAKTLGEVDRQGLQNISLEMNDARDYLSRFVDACLDEIFILYPDPWPKRRHWKRRIIEPVFVDELARLLKPGAKLRFISDIAHYQQWALLRILNSNKFDWQASSCADWRNAPSDHTTTKYEQKAFREKRTPAYLLFERNHLI